METRRSRYASAVARTLYGLRSKKGRKGLQSLDFRSLGLEPLEQRQLLAINLVSLIPNEGADISAGGTLNVAPREFTFKFTDGQIIDPNSLLGIRIRRAGDDGMFNTGDDVDVDPLRAGAGTVPRGFVGIGNFSNEVVLRFAETLPDDLYQIIIIGDSTTAPADPLNPLGKELQNTAAEPYNLGANTIISLDIDRGTQIVGVVPQPVRRVGAGLVQDKNLVEVYFNPNDPPSVASVETEAFYDLIFTGSDTSSTIIGDVHYTPTSATWVPAENKVVLDFGTPLHLLGSGQGTYRLRVGNDAAPIVTGAPVAVGEFGNNDFATSVHNVGTLAGAQSVIRTSAIDPDVIFLPGLPGNDSDPGNRQLPFDLNSHGGGGGGGSTNDVYLYDFDPTPRTNSAGVFPNNITENQKQRAREIFAIYSYYTGIQFQEVATGGNTIFTGDMRASDPLLPPVGGPAGISGDPIVINETLNFGISEFGGSWFTIAMHEIGHNLGLGHAYELTSITIQGDGSPLDIGTDPVYPGDHDITHVRAGHRPDKKDIDFYKFQLDNSGKFSTETIAERLPAHAVTDQLDSLITMYEEIDTLKVLPTSFATLDGRSFTITDSNAIPNTVTFIFDLNGDTVTDNATTVGIDYTAATTQSQLATAIATAINNHAALNSDATVDGTTVKIHGLITLAPDVPGTFPLTHKVNVRDQIARNDDYYSEDSYLELQLNRGVYYIAVSSSGNSDFDPEIPNSGNGGHTLGQYNLRMNFVADTFNTIVDADGAATQLDGDGDGRPGGLYNFWFKVADEISSHTVFVDKAEPGPVFDGSEANPYRNIDDALADPRLVNTAAGQFDILRIVGNPGNDANLATPDIGALPYEIGADGSTLDDGIRLDIPRGVTTMIDAGAVFKLLAANITAGSTAQGVNRSEGHLQVLGTPQTQVYFTSYYDESIGEDSPPTPTTPGRGDWGGLVFRNDLDYAEMNIPAAGTRRVLEQAGAFINYVNGADLRYGGGQVSVNSQSQEYQPIYLDDARPTITHNTITNSAHAAMSADPASFTDEKFQDSTFTADYERVGPHIHDNRLATYNNATGALVAQNSLNGLFVRIRQNAGTPLDSLTGFGRFDDTDITHILQENLFVQGTPGGLLGSSSRLDARLKIDPGTVVKAQGARIEVGFGAQLLAEGTDAGRVVITALGDDNWGFGGTFDTNGNFAGSAPQPGDWSGIFFGHTSTGSIDHAHIAYGGGTSRIEGGSDRFNVIEIHQSDVRIVNSTLQNNDDGAAASSRVNRQGNAPATIFVRGSQPTIVNNIIRDNDAVAININVNSLRAALVRDPGRSTGVIDTFDEFKNNYGPLVRLNRLGNNAGGNGMNIRGGNLNVQSVWDDTDIAHILTQTIQAVDLQHYGGLRLQSSETESLVVKLSGPATAGFQATGLPLDVNDRIGGTIHIIGTPQFPVVLTSLADDTVGAGFNPIGQPMLDTNNNGPSTGTAGAWRSVRLDKYANDRNSAVVREVELPYTNGVDANGTANTAQFVGSLAKDQKSGDDNQRLGIEVQGTVAWDDTTDVDVYSFRGTAGSEVWLDIDFTTHALDTVVELVLNDGSDTVVARSNNSVGLALNPDTFDGQGVINNASLAGNIGRRMDRDSYLLPNGTDFYTTNPRDAGMRVVLPGSVGTEETYFVRVRSKPETGSINTVKGGSSQGAYTLQVRTRELDEFPGSTVRYSDMRFGGGGGLANSATIELLGVPYHSFLTGESRETTATNDAILQSQNLGNLLQQERNTIGVSGTLTGAGDVDWFTVGTQYLEIQSIGSVNASDKSFAAVFDVDYANGLSRGDTNLAVFNRTGGGSGLMFFGTDSNVADDLPDPLAGSSTTDFSRGSFGTRDPFIGPIHLPTPGPSGTPFDYRVAMSSNERMPTVLNQYYVAAPAAPNVRLEPINSINRIAEDHIGFTGAGSNVPADVPQLFTGTTGTALSTYAAPFTLSDVTLFVQQRGVNGRLRTIDPFTGLNETNIGDPTDAGQGLLDVAMRNDGRLFTLTARSAAGNTQGQNPGTVGNFREINTGNAGQTSSADDNIEVFLPDTTNPGPPQGQLTQPAMAIEFEGMAFDQADNSEAGRQLWAVGNLIGDDATNSGAPNANQRFNLLYRLNPDTGSAIDQGGSGANPISNPRPSQNREILNLAGGGGNAGEFVTGLAFVNGTLFGVSSQGTTGRLYTITPGGAVATLVATFPNRPFTGLTHGPETVAGGRYADLLFATDNNGQLLAFNATVSAFDPVPIGTPRPIFVGGASSIAMGVGSVSGLAFSTLDYNLWHFTDAEPGSAAGHGVFTAPDNSVREAETTNRSWYFGLENPDGRSGVLDLNGGGGTQPDSNSYSSNLPVYDTYDLPGGAYGALLTNSFSLEGYATEDKPTLYFTYFLETQGAADSGPNAGMRDSARVFISDDGGVSWDMVATNNSANDPDGYNPPTLILTSTDSELPEFKSWSTTASQDPRQRIQELFDTNNWRQAHIDLGEYAGRTNLMLRFDFSTSGDISDEASSPGGQYAIPMTGDAFGNFGNAARGQLNDNRGFFVDDIIIGLAERGEMVLNAPADVLTHFTANVDPTPDFFTLVSGEYQLEVRRGPEYGSLPSKIKSDLMLGSSYDSNDRHVQDFTLTTPAGAAFTNGQTLTVSDGVTSVTFTFTNTPGGPNDINTAGATNSTMATRINTAINGAFGGRVTAARVAPGSSYVLENPKVDLFHAARVTTTAPLIINSADTSGFNIEGDRNAEREQGMVKIEQNRVTSSASYAITLDEGARDNANNTPHPGGIHHLRQLNIDQQWVPSAVVENNVLSGGTLGGILVSGDPNLTVQSVIPFARILNNTIFGRDTLPGIGIGIDVSQRASPTILNNIVSNLQTGVRVDASSAAAGTVMQGTVYKNNTVNVTGTGTGSFAILMSPADPLFVDPANGNFYLASGSLAIDSSIESLPDRPELVNIYTAAGISQSNIIAPEFDQFGNKRVDDPTVSPVALGLGANVFIDRGALERVNTLTINDVTVVEGNVGTVNAVFTVLLTRTTSSTVTVEYNTTDGDAVFGAGADYLPTSGTLTFNPGQTTQLITVRVNGDVVDEDNEVFFVNLFNETNAVVADVQGIGTINDDDALPSVSVLDTSATEGDVGNSPMVFAIVMSPPSGRNVTVNFNTSPGTAIASPLPGADYTSTAGNVVFSPGEGTKFVTVQIIGDATVEPNETFFLNLVGVTNATIVDNQALGTIQDDDLKISISDGNPTPAVEGDPPVNTNVVFSVTLSGNNLAAVTVVYAANPGLAPAAQLGLDFDYSGGANTPGTLTFAPGDTQEFITVRVLGDVINEFDENFTVDLSGAVGAAILDPQGDGKITDSPIDPVPVLAIANVSLTEGDSGLKNFVFNVTLNRPSGKQVTVNFATADGTAQDDTPAVEDDDYIATSGVLTFAPGSTLQQVTVQVRGNDLVEPDETFFVNLTSPANATLPGAPPLVGTGTILDDEVRISINDVVHMPSEGDAGSTPVVFTVSINKPTANPLTVNYSTADQSATAGPGNDYDATAGALLFTVGGTTSLPITVMVHGDVVGEFDETFAVNLSIGAPTNTFATITDSQGIGTIIDDEAKVFITAVTPTVTEGDSGMFDVFFDVQLDRAATGFVTITVEKSDFTATDPDYDFTDQIVAFGVGQISKRVTAQILGDLLDELDEQFFIDLKFPTGGLIIKPGQGTATQTILDNDNTPVVSITAITDPGLFPPDDPNDSTVLEGDAGSTFAYFLVSLNALSGQSVTARYDTANNSAAAGSDFTGVVNGTVSFAPNETSKLISIAVTGDTTLEPNETFFVNISAPVNATLGTTQATGTIIDDEPRASVFFDSVVGTEGTNPSPAAGQAVFRIVLDKMPASPVTVNFATANDTALSGLDFTGVSGVENFTSGAFGAGLTRFVTVNFLADSIDEIDEGFFLNITGAANLVAVPQAAATILDDDAAPTLAFVANVSTPEGDAGTTPAVFTVALSSPSGKTITVQYATRNFTGADPAAPSLDYNTTTGTLTFLPGQTQQSLTVQVLGDLLGEPDEFYFVDLLSPVNASGTPTATGRIVDNEPRVTIADAVVLEGDAPGVNADFVVSLNKPSDSPVQVILTYATSDGTALSPADYTGTTNSTLVFAPGQTVKSLLVPITGDVFNEDNETFTVNFTSVTNALVSDGNALGTIVDNDPLPSLAIGDASVVEGTGGLANIVFRVSLTPASGRTVTVNYTTADDVPLSASVGADYALTAGTLVFPQGTSFLDITVPITTDNVGEPNETFRVDLSAPDKATIADSRAIGTIIDDEPRIAISDVTVNEAAGNAVFTVSLLGPASGDVSFGYTTVDSTAVQPGDYTASAGALTFTLATTETVKQITVAIGNDTLDENSESFFVNLSSPSSNAVISDAQGVGTITDDDAPPTVSILDATIVEGDSGTVDLVFTVQLSTASGLQVTVPFSTTNGSATVAGSDYFATSGTLTFAPGDTTAKATVQVRGDTLAEPTESFFVNLGTPVNATVADGSASGVITDDEPLITILDPVAIVEGDAGSQNLVFEVQLNRMYSQVVTVNYITANNLATAPADYTNTSGLISFAINQTQQFITVAIQGDLLDEANETFFVNLSSPSSNAQFGDNQGVGTINDNDATPSLSIGDVSVNETSSGTISALFPVVLSAPSGLTVTVVYSTANGILNPATAGSDYVAVAGATLTFNPGETSKAAAVTVNGDLAAELNETFFVNLSGELNATISDNQGLGTIVDNEPRVTILPGSILEGDFSTVQMEFVVQLTKASSQPIQIVYSTEVAGLFPATPGVDYTAAAGATLVFNPGQVARSILIPVLGDTLDEENETFRVRLNSAVNAIITTDVADGTITDNDALPSVSINDISVTETNGGTTNAVFTVSLSAPSGRQVTVAFNSADGTATTADGDYNTTSGVLTFNPNEVTQQVTVAVVGDDRGEPNEAFLVNLLSPVNATLGDSQGQGTIVDDEPRITILDPTPITEGDGAPQSLVFEVRLDRMYGQPVSVAYSTGNNSAVSPDDYATTSGVINFAINQTQQFVTVSIQGDVLDEANETFFVNLSGPSANAVIADAQGLGTIVDNDGPPSVTITDVSVTEGNSGTVNAVFTVQLSAATGLEVRVPYTTADGTATVAGSDYFAAAGTVTIAPLSLSQTITVQVRGDAQGEVDENFVVNLGTPSNATLADAQGVGTIGDDEPRITILDPVAVTEGDASSQNMVFDVRLDRMYGQAVTVSYATANNTATSPADYSAASGAITFAINQTQQFVTIAIQGDTLDEIDETFFVNLSGASANAVLADSQATGTILDNDATPTLSIGDVSVTEGQVGQINALFPVTLSAASGQTVTVIVNTLSDTATAGSDFNGITNATLVFNPGEVSKNVTVAVNGDLTAELDETYFVNLSGAVNASILDGVAIGTIGDDEPRASVTGATVTEGDAGSLQAQFLIRLNKIFSQPVRVVYSTDLGAGPSLATAGVDYTASSNVTVTFNPGQTQISVLVPILGDLLDEDDETFSVRLNSAVNAIIAVDLAEGRILDNDALPVMTISDVSVTEGNSGTVSAVATVTLSTASGRLVGVAYTTADASATTADGDYVTASGVLNFAPGQTTQQITVTVVGDNRGEPNETLVVNLSGHSNAQPADSQGVITIGDDEPRITILDNSLVEQDVGVQNLVFEVRLDRLYAEPVTVNYTTADGSALAPADYSAASGLVSFAANQTQQFITISVKGDLLDENDETFAINLSSATPNAVIADNAALGTIRDNDAPPTVTIVDATVTEGNIGVTDAVFRLLLSAPSGLEVQVPFSTANGTATVAGNDYNANTGVVTFAPGSTERFLTVQVKADTTGELDENFLVNLMPPPVNATIADGQAVGTIVDDEPRILVNDVTVNEADATVNLVFSVTLSSAPVANVTVIYNTAAITATAGADYTPVSGTLTFQSGLGETLKAVTVQIAGDLLDEADENFQLNLSGASANAVISDGQGIGTIVDNDSQPNLAIGDATVNEGNTGTVNLVFPITLSAPSGQTVSVLASTVDGTAAGAVDYVSLASSLVTFNPGETQKNVTVQVIGDREAESNETLVVNLASPSNAGFSDNQGIGTIVDDEPILSIDPVTVTESNGDVNAVFVVRMDRASGEVVNVGYFTADGTAVAPGDYAATTSGSLSFGIGQIQALLTVTVRGDTLNEPSETFSVTLNAVPGNNAKIGTGTATGTIVNDDPLPTVSINSPAAITELNNPLITSPLVFAVTLSAASGQTVSVQYATADGTAIAGILPAGDYSSTSGTLVFAPGETQKLVTAQVHGDALGEANETFFVQLQSPVNVNIAGAVGTGTILDDEPRITINDAPGVVEGNSAVFTVLLTGVASSNVTVTYSTAPGTASAGLDYISDSSSVVFLVGESSKPITVNTLGDSLNENSETFLVNLSLVGNNAVISDSQGVGTITDDDPLPQISISDASVIEGDAGTANMVFTVSLSAASGRAVTANYATSAGTATLGGDFNFASGAVSFAPGATQQQVTVQVNGDLAGEFDETFSVTLSNPNNGTIADGVGQGTIRDDDARLQINDVVVTEGDAGTVQAVFSVTLTEASVTGISVNYSTAAGTAASGPDFQAASGLLSFSPGNTQQSITVNVQGDVLDEADETFFVNLSGAVGTIVLDSQGQGTILDNDLPPNMSINSVSVTEGDTPGTVNAIFTVTLSQASGQQVSTEYLSTPISASPGVDYSSTSGTLLFAAGQVQQQITVQVAGDLLPEPNETFQVSLFNAANANVTTATGTGTIQDDEPRLSISDATVIEGDSSGSNAVFNITINRTFPTDVTVAYATANGTALGGSDYQTDSGSLTIAAGSTSVLLTVPVLGDLEDENNETFFVNLSSPTGGLILDGQGQATILDNDPQITISDVTVTESTNASVAAVFTVTLNKSPAVAASVAFATSNGVPPNAAIAGTDYTATSGVLNFAVGQTQKMITVNVAGDSLNEASETFNVDLSSALNGQIVDVTGVGTIQDDDVLPQVLVNNITVQEGGPGTNNTAVFTLTLSPVSGQEVLVSVATAVGNGNASSNDFVASSGTITFAPGVTTAKTTVQVVGDAAVEPNETFVLNLASATNATTPFTFGTATIVNDDTRQIYVTGADAGGGPHVRVFDSQTGAEKFGFFAYSPAFGGGVRVAAGDVNGDGTPDIVTTPGAGGGPHVRVFNGVNGAELYGFFAFDTTQGLQVAMGDVNGDGRADIIIGTDGAPGGAARVGVFNGATGALISQYAFGAGSGLETGIRVAAGDVNGDGDADLILGSGPGSNATVRVQDATSGEQIANFSPYPGFTGGVYVSGGDTNQDGRSEVITGAGAGGGPHVRVFSGANLNTELFGFFAYSPAFGGGVRVAATDYNADGRADIVTAAGPGGGPHVRIFSGANLLELHGFMAYPGFGGGVNVGGSFRGVGAALTASGGAGGSGSLASLTQEDVAPLVQQAISQWAAAGLDQQSLARLASVDVRIAALPREYLATASHGAIMLDADAAGRGWFIDPTPWSDEEFEVLAEGVLRARQDGAAGVGMDLLTVLAHELGHILGLGHGDSLSEDVMEEALSAGTRRLPTAEDVDGLFSAGSWD